jgi:hypothetical protein
MVRRAAESLPQTEELARMRGVRLNPDTVAEAWRQVLLFYEHTWGSWNSISEPYAELTLTSWERKRAFAEDAEKLAHQLREMALQDLGRRRANPMPSPGEERSVQVEIINTLPWPRTDLVVLRGEDSPKGARVLNPSGVMVPSQILRNGDLAFLAEDVPGESSVLYSVEGDPPPGGRPRSGQSAGTRDAEGPEPGSAEALENSGFRVVLDPETGDLSSLIHRPSARELVDASKGGLDQYLYVPGRDPAAAVGAGEATVEWVERGPLVWSLSVTSAAPGLRGPLVRTYRFVEGLDRFQVTNHLTKEWVLDPEAVLFRFPFAVEDPQVRIDAPFGFFRPESDQVPGASKNYYSLQRWVDLSNTEWGVTITSIDAPLIQLGEIRTDPIVVGWVEEAESSATLFSYVMNNYWETNYRAAQDDEVEFRYTVRVHHGFDEVEVERFALEDARPLVARKVER